MVFSPDPSILFLLFSRNGIPTFITHGQKSCCFFDSGKMLHSTDVYHVRYKSCCFFGSGEMLPVPTFTGIYTSRCADSANQCSALFSHHFSEIGRSSALDSRQDLSRHFRESVHRAMLAESNAVFLDVSLGVMRIGQRAVFLDSRLDRAYVDAFEIRAIAEQTSES